AGVQMAVLNPIESLTAAQEKAGEDYLSLMRENLDTLRKALYCGGAARPAPDADRGEGCLVRVRPSVGPRGRRSRGPRGRVRRVGGTERVGQVDAAPPPARLARSVVGHRPSVRRAAVAVRGPREERLRA